MRIATYNVLADAFVKPERYEGVPEKYLEPRWRRERVVQRCVDMAADVLCLQEVDTALLDALAKAFPDHDRIGAPRGGRRPDGIAILVKRPLAVRASRVVAAEGTVALIVETGDLRIVTVHLDWDAPDSIPEKRKGLAQMKALLPELGAAQGILCGDFNAKSDSMTLQLARAAGWNDARGGSPIATGAANGHRNAVDWLMHGPELAATLVCPTKDCGLLLPDEHEPSDHVVVAADFRRV